MKKIIVAATGLMIANSALVATAAVEFSGDARARYYFQDNYNSKNDSADHWNSRVRLNIKGTTAGGAYAKVRLVMQDSPWGGGEGTGGMGDNESSIDTDIAYIAVPLGNDFVVTAGRQPLELSTGFLNDIDLDNLRLKYENEDTKVTTFYSVISSYNMPSGEYDNAEDTLYGAAIEQRIGEWTVFAGLAYQSSDLSADQESGVMASVGAAGQIGPIALTGELGFQEDGVVATDELALKNTNVDITGDDGFGGYVTAGVDFNALDVTFLGGATTEGFTFDIPVGFVMIGGDNQITPGKTYAIGHYDDTAVDTFFAGVKTNYTFTEDLAFGFNLAYANMEASDRDVSNSEIDGNLYEVSATAAYTINDGTMLYVNAGYLDVEWEDDPTIGVGVSLELTF